MEALEVLAPASKFIASFFVETRHGGVMVSILAFQVSDSGSTPGHGKPCIELQTFLIIRTTIINRKLI